MNWFRRLACLAVDKSMIPSVSRCCDHYRFIDLQLCVLADASAYPDFGSEPPNSAACFGNSEASFHINVGLARQGRTKVAPWLLHTAEHGPLHGDVGFLVWFSSA